MRQIEASCILFNHKEGLIPRSLLRNKLMTNEVSLGLIPPQLAAGSFIYLSKNSLLEHYATINWDCSRDGRVLIKVSTSSSIFSSTRSQCSSKSFRNI